MRLECSHGTIVASWLDGRRWPRDASGAVGEHPEMEGLMQGGEVAIDFASRRQVGESVGQNGSVLGESQKFDGVKCFEQRRAELIGGTELRGPGGAVLFKGKAVQAGLEERLGVGREMFLIILQEPSQDGALDACENGGVGEELQLSIHNVGIVDGPEGQKLSMREKISFLLGPKIYPLKSKGSIP